VALRAQARGFAGPLAPFGVGEAAVQSMLLRVLDGGGTLIRGSPIVDTIQKGYARVPAAMRAQATTAAFAWAKGYLHSPAFATAYAKFRQQHRPAAAAGEAGSIDEVVRQRINAYVAELEGSKTALDVLSPADRAKGIKNIDDAIANARSPENAKGCGSPSNSSAAKTRRAISRPRAISMRNGRPIPRPTSERNSSTSWR
jgi:hypothetical protein